MSVKSFSKMIYLENNIQKYVPILHRGCYTSATVAYKFLWAELGAPVPIKGLRLWM
jgi:hypothetical protein